VQLLINGVQRVIPIIREST